MSILNARRGGPGRGQGRKPLDPKSPTVIFALRLSTAQREQLRRLGGATWIRHQLQLWLERNP